MGSKEDVTLQTLNAVIIHLINELGDNDEISLDCGKNKEYTLKLVRKTAEEG